MRYLHTNLYVLYIYCWITIIKYDAPSEPSYSPNLVPLHNKAVAVYVRLKQLQSAQITFE